MKAKKRKENAKEKPIVVSDYMKSVKAKRKRNYDDMKFLGLVPVSSA